MSEKAPSTVINAELPSSLDYDQLDMRTYKNGANHVYGIDKDGKKRHISADDVVEAYGYNPADSAANNELRNSSEAVSNKAEAELPDFKEGDIVKVPSMLKSEKGKIKEYRVVRIAESVDKDGDRGVLLTSLDGKEDMSTMYSGVQKRMAESAVDTDETKSTNTAESGNKGALRSIEDGEFGDDYLHRSENSDPNDPDYLPVGVMAGEPWTFADKDGTPVKSGTTPSGTTPGTSLVPTGEKPNPGYDGPVESGSEIEHVPSSEIEHVPGTGIVPVPEVDPRTRIGEAINTRMNELMENGMSEEDAHAQAHDEFWGGDVHENNEDEGGDDGEGDPNQIEFTPSPELSELNRMLDAAQHRYAEATSRSRNSTFGRFLKEDSKFMGIVGKLTGMQKLINKLKNSEKVQNWTTENDKNRQFLGDAETIAAKEEYDKLYQEVAVLTGQELEAAGLSAELAKSWALYGETERDKALAFDIADRREANSKSTNGFVNWWVNAKGWKGKLAKAGLVGVAGIAAGAGVGVLGGGFLAAAIAGGVTGNAIAGYVTKRRANSISKESGRTLAQDQAIGDHAKAATNIVHSYATDQVSLSPSESIARTEQTTDDEMIGNRRRRRAAIAIGKAGAVFGLGQYHNLFGDKPKPTDPTTPKPKDPKTPTPKDPTPKPPEVAPKPPTPEVPRPQFDVEPGSGFEREISQYFANNGKPISGSEAHKLYQSLEQTYGPNGLIKPSETYLRSGTDFGISRPGMYEVADGPAKVLSDWLAAK